MDSLKMSPALEATGHGLDASKVLDAGQVLKIQTCGPFYRILVTTTGDCTVFPVWADQPLQAFSQLVDPRLQSRIGHVRHGHLNQ